MSNCWRQFSVLSVFSLLISSVFCQCLAYWSVHCSVNIWMEEVLFCLKFELLMVWLYWFTHCQWRAEVWLVTCLILSLHMLAFLMLLIQTAQHRNSSTHSHVFTTVKCWVLTNRTQNETKSCLFFLFFFQFLLIGSWLLVNNFSSPLMLYSVILLSFFAPCTLILHVVVDCFGGDTFCVMTVWFYMWLLTISWATHSAYQFDFTWGCWLFQGLHILHDISLILPVVVDYFRGHTFCMISVWFYVWLLTFSRATDSAWWQFDFTGGCWLFQGRHILRDDFTACPSCDFPAIFSEFIRFVFMSGASISCDLGVACFSVHGL